MQYSAKRIIPPGAIELGEGLPIFPAINSGANAPLPAAADIVLMKLFRGFGAWSFKGLMCGSSEVYVRDEIVGRKRHFRTQRS